MHHGLNSLSFFIVWGSHGLFSSQHLHFVLSFMLVLQLLPLIEMKIGAPYDVKTGGQDSRQVNRYISVLTF